MFAIFIKSSREFVPREQEYRGLINGRIDDSVNGAAAPVNGSI
jgi:hypothetical protein